MSGMFAARQPTSITQKLLRVRWGIIFLLALLAGVGTAALYSVAGGSIRPWAEIHAVRFLMSVGVLIAIALVPLDVWRTLSYPVYAVALALLIAVPFIGVDAMGAKRWLNVGGMTFQPAELMKVAMIAALARYYHDLSAALVSRPVAVLVPLALIIVPVALILRQPDLGTAMLLSAAGLFIMFLAGVSWTYYLAGAAGTVAAAPFVWSALYDYQQRRIAIFLDPEKDPLGAGYHIMQSKIALGAGGVSGQGYMQGTQSQLNFVPEQHTDFVFTMLGEEWGFVGAIALIMLFAALILALLAMGLAVRSQFGRLLIAGCAVILFLYVFINIAMVTGLVPVVGVPLPLVSYGGTSMITLMVAIGLAMCARVHSGPIGR